MKLVSRSAWGAAAPTGSYARISSTRGAKVHYEGSAVPGALAGDHGRCAGHVRDVQHAHLNDPKEDWIDIAYSFLVCPHGYVFEGRGLNVKNGANGNPTLNAGHYAICAMVGTSGITSPTDEMLNGLVDAIEYCRAQGGAGGEVRGHRDGYATTCPGDELYAWVQRGAPRPGNSGQAPAPAPAPPSGSSSAPSFPGRVLRLAQPMMHGPDVQRAQERLIERTWSVGPDGADGWYGERTRATVVGFQRDSSANGWPLADDGEIGPLTWAALWDRPVTR
ncbi:N-acetylmuramoyl-L-alanine amidase [Kitasatospora sp. NA04385]|uniref:peptidoglycan recognition protein family protein n=1 Tax=Kitasatospora sp. NA04385 TaxID=2742135 RepID=UPI001592903E|nr:N-acetylmuramoyl-L-alanine amidase [Kitasatospora sp. NA04385]QKW22317.1 N-acetylmuramoyl-L-alanine amidase [Kitasatospora sp. NA04385]